MSRYVHRNTPSGYQSNTLMFEEDHEPVAVGTHSVRLVTWREADGTVRVQIPVDEVPAYAAALLAEYVKIKAEQSRLEMEKVDFGSYST